MQDEKWFTLDDNPAAKPPLWQQTRGSLTAYFASFYTTISARVLNERQTDCDFTREILLLGDQHILLYAYSRVSPLITGGRFEFVTQLGTKPLGTQLFADKTITRGPLLFAQIDEQSPLYQQMQMHFCPVDKQVWARRSTFQDKQQQLELVEVFLTD